MEETTEKPDRRPPFLSHRWARCVRCLKHRRYAVVPSARLADFRSPCCHAPVRTEAWRGWRLDDPENRINLATYGTTFVVR